MSVDSRVVAPERTKHAGGLVALLGALSAFGPITTDVYLPSLPQAGADLQVSSSAIQSSLTTCLLGLAVGQLLVGPVSDRWGRRTPMVAGMAVFTVASVLCAVAPDIWLLDVFRLVQGLAGAAGIVVSFAIVRDLYSGHTAARAFSILLAVNSVAPILSPIVGAQLLRVMDWRGLFLVLAGLGLVFLGAAVVGVPETLAEHARSSGRVGETVRTLRRVGGDPGFLGFALAGGLAFAAMFAYISASSFVFQDVYRTSPQLFSLYFAINGIGILLANTVNSRLVGRVSPRTLLRTGLAGVLLGAVATLVTTLAGLGIWALEPALFVMASSIGLVLPNATALALDDYGDVSGSASAILGFTQFLFGAAVAPLVGVAGRSAVPMGIVTVTVATLAVAGHVLLHRHRTE